jgi:hypothetical protein
VTTNMHYYLGVKTIPDAVDAIGKLSFMKVLDKAAVKVQSLTNRITLAVGPASADDDLSKGLMIYIGGSFTPEEMKEMDNLSVLADKAVTLLVAQYAAKQMIALQSQGKFATHKILGN